MTKILKCNCENKWQDERYGKQMRVMNIFTKNGKEAYRCTVCGSEKSS